MVMNKVQNGKIIHVFTPEELAKKKKQPSDEKKTTKKDEK